MRSVRRSAWRRAVLLQSQVSPCNRGAISAGDGCRFRYWSEQRTGIEFWGSQFSERHYTARQPAPDPRSVGPAYAFTASEVGASQGSGGRNPRPSRSILTMAVRTSRYSHRGWTATASSRRRIGRAGAIETVESGAARPS
jgi:hypothetical protein